MDGKPFRVSRTHCWSPWTISAPTLVVFVRGRWRVDVWDRVVGVPDRDIAGRVDFVCVLSSEHKWNKAYRTPIHKRTSAVGRTYGGQR